MIIRRVILKLNEPTKETGRVYLKYVIRKMINEFNKRIKREVYLVSVWEKKNYYTNYLKVYGKVISLKIIKNNLIARIKIFDGIGVTNGDIIAELIKNKIKVKFSPAFIAETDTITHKVKYCKLINIHPRANDEWVK